MGGYAPVLRRTTFDADAARWPPLHPTSSYVHTSARNLGNLPLQTEHPNRRKRNSPRNAPAGRACGRRRPASGCPVVQNNFELPGLRVMGSMDAAVDPHGRVRFVNRMNAMLADWARPRPISICMICAGSRPAWA